MSKKRSTMFLHLLDKFGKPLAVLATSKRLPLDKRAELVWSLNNHDYTAQLDAHRAYMALPGKPDRFTRRVPPERLQGVGVLSPEKVLSKLPRFTGNGEIKAAFKVLRGDDLIELLDKLTTVAPPPINGGNLAPAWTKATAPRKTSKVTTEQIGWAQRLRSQGVAWRKVGEMVGLPTMTLRDAMAQGV